MKILNLTLLLFAYFAFGCAQQAKKDPPPLKLHKLTPAEKRVMIDGGTEAPFSGKYDNFFGKGTYVCKRCGAPLFRSENKFRSGCGWPSFDKEIKGAILRIPDPDGFRTEIRCARCGAHLGHVFTGEHLTARNVRYCVNSIAMVFIPDKPAKAASDTAIFAGGCFWGVEYYMQKAPGVISAEVGYIGGRGAHPTYEEVCSHTTGYAEAVRIVFDPSKTNYENIAKLFFEIHDPTQLDRQGPDIGDQYRSAVFYRNNQQKQIAEKLIRILKTKGYKVVTQVVPATKFWKAEAYHQNYYLRNGGTPYCHGFVKRF